MGGERGGGGGGGGVERGEGGGGGGVSVRGYRRLSGEPGGRPAGHMPAGRSVGGSVHPRVQTDYYRLASKLIVLC